MRLYYFYRMPALSEGAVRRLKEQINSISEEDVLKIETEYCFYVQSEELLTEDEVSVLRWLLAETFQLEGFSTESFLERETENSLLIEVGPRMNFTTSWSTNAVSICTACGIDKIKRIERSRRYRFYFRQVLPQDRSDSLRERILPLIHDRMTECPYPERLTSFDTGIKPEPVRIIPLIEEGIEALKKINREMGLGLDEQDIEYYYNLFVHDLRRNPTDVECFDLGQSNSEHSRHWFFKGRLIIDGKEAPHTLMSLIKEPLTRNPSNSVIAFRDNSSAIRGFRVRIIKPEDTTRPSAFREEDPVLHPIFTAETHNFPTGVAPFPGAETGTGGRIRDVHATGRGSHVIAGTAAYCVGNLRIPGYELPWEEKDFSYPGNLATPLQIEIEASNGASDYGNKFGEPVIQGFTRSFGLRAPDGQRWEWVKPIMFTGGVGQIDDRHTEKGEPEVGMLVVKIGGPAYRIGIGGGAASSMIQGENVEELDFSAVQRGDAEMEQKLNRVIRACIEMGEENPIISIHDQGAGGNSNVLKEIVYPEGARIEVRKILLGDETLSVLEIWGAEYQENDALLLRPESLETFRRICEREKLPFSVVGEVTGDGYVVLYDEMDDSTPVNLPLAKVLGKMPQKTFNLESRPQRLEPLTLPKGLRVREALDRVLRNLAVGSKRFLTNKVDRSVTGLIVQQQCVGPMQLTLSDVAVVAQSHFSTTGVAISIGEQPLKTLISPEAMARLAVTEALTNLMWAKISRLEDVKCSGNWMWAPKLPGEGIKLYQAARALRDILIELGIAIDGGKDSLSMAAIVRNPDGTSEVVKSPGTLVVSAYAPCTDITKVITPDIKRPGSSRLIYVNLSGWRFRPGGSALAQVFKQIGDESPDLVSAEALKDGFNAVQELIDRGLILSGHDCSDGGLITCILEMAFGGNGGLRIELQTQEADPLRVLFSEEPGFVVEYLPENESDVIGVFEKYRLSWQKIGETIEEDSIIVFHNTREVLKESMTELRLVWEETSYQIDRLQANPECVDEERETIRRSYVPPYRVSFEPEPTPHEVLLRRAKPKVAVLREEGSNGDREMASAFWQAGFEVWDVTMTDLLRGEISLREFKGIAFVGGFSYADVLDSAKGWAGVIRFNRRVYEEFESFYERSDTFSLGVCNGCQLMALLGWVPYKGLEDHRQVRFIKNRSERFESRFSTVKILPSPSIMLKGMEGSILGVWVAHGEGRVHFPDEKLKDDVLSRGLAPLRYVDDRGEVTTVYPFNPNGSPEGITGLCSPDGRHLAMMPHPERTFLLWQWAWIPEEWSRGMKASPWLRMFQNARVWCDEV
jgi:phosphoribosylformylglycinamidine synthase